MPPKSTTFSFRSAAAGGIALALSACSAWNGADLLNLGLIIAAQEGNVCHAARVGPALLLTSRHCISGAHKLGWDKIASDWTLLQRPAKGPILPVRPLSYIALLKAVESGELLSVAGQSPCRVLPLHGTGFFSSDCRVKPGESGSPVTLTPPAVGGQRVSTPWLVGIVSGYDAEGHSIITSAEAFASSIP